MEKTQTKHFDTTKKVNNDALRAALKREIQNTAVMIQMRLQEKLRRPLQRVRVKIQANLQP